MYALNAYIKIRNYVFNYPVSVNIVKSTRSLSDTAEIVLPASAVLKNNRRVTLEKLIKRGHLVTVKLGYNGNLNTEFIGFVLAIASQKDNTVKISCENNAYLLRVPAADKLFVNAKLTQIITHLACGIELNNQVPDVNFDKFLIKNTSAYDALLKLKDEYGFVIFIDNAGKLFCGLPYTYMHNTVKYNLALNTVASELVFKNADDIKLKIKAISILKNNTKIEIETGDPNGELRTLHFRNISNKSELENFANAEMLRYKYTGYRGSVTGFGLPETQKADTVNLQDPNYPEYKGNYYAEQVNIEYGQNGFRRKIEIGIKL